jgi:hypothetical protein
MCGFRRLAAIALPAVCVLALNCSKKSESPTAPPNPPVCSLSSTSLGFGVVTVGSSADRQFTLTNTGGGTLSGTVSEACSEFSLVGTNTYSLDAGESATFTLRFSPTGAGAKNCTVNTGNSACSVVSCAGTGQAAPGPDCEISPTSLDFGSVQIGDFATRRFAVVNAGTDTLRGTVSESCDDVRIRGDGAYALAAGQGATFTVDFYPVSAGPMSCSITTGAGCASVSCTGSGTGGLSAACEVIPTSLEFGSVPVGFGVTCKTFTVRNVSTNSVISGQPSFSNPYLDWEWAPGSGGSYYLNPGESKTYTFCFRPASTGPKEATIIIPERDEFCSSVSCTGLGVEPPPVCEVDVSSSNTTTLDLGTLAVGQRRRNADDVVDFGIANHGGGVLSGAVSAPCNQLEVYRGGGGSLSYDLKTSESAYFGVGFAPVTPGPQNCTIETGNGLCTDIRVRANAITSSSPCWVETPSIDFGIVRPNAQPRTVQRFLRMTSVYSAGLSGQVYSPCSDFRVSVGAFALGPGQSSQSYVSLDIPGGTQQVGERSCTLNLDATGTSDCPIVQCSATIKNTAGTATPLGLAFPATPVGQTRDLTFTITSSSAISGTVTVPCPAFSVVGDASYNIAAGGQATFTVRYTPTAIGLHQCTVSTGSDCESVWVYGTGYVP